MAAVGVLWVGGVGGQEPCTPPTPDQNDDHSIPDYKDTLAGSYTLVVEMTSMKQNLTYYVEEERERRVYHDYFSDTAAVSVVNNGSTTVFHFYPIQGRFNTQYGDRCISSGEQPGFLPWGWYDVDPAHGDANYGPSSLLRLASYMNTEFVGGDEVLEGVKVEQWKTCTEDGKVAIKYYFSERPWSMPYANWFSEGDGRVPVRIHVGFTDNSMAWQYNIVQFLPFVESHSSLETPRGLACENLVSVMSDVKIPDIPWHFSLAEEVVKNSQIDGNIYGTQHLDKLQMTYAGKLSLVSLTYLPMDDSTPTPNYELELIHDFNTGVQYTVNREYGNCSLGFIPSFSFDSHYAGFIGSGGMLLSPNDVFHIDDSYAFVGEEELHRAPEGDRFTSTRMDIPDPDTNGVYNYKKAVLEYYFSQGQEVTPSGNVPVNLPIRADLFVYNSSNLLQMVSTATTNFYDFQEINLYSEEEFSIQECYEKYDDRWSYIVLFFPATKEKQFELVKDEVKRFKHELISQLVSLGNMSPVRIADIQVEDGVSGVIPNTTNADMITVSVKLLERAPYIYTYRTPLGEEYQNPGSKEKSISDIEALEDCAALCSQEEAFTCKSFHHCDYEVCFLSATENTDGNEINSYDVCRHWIFNLTNKTFEDYPTQKVYTEILTAIKNRKFSFSILYKEEQVNFEASASLHYRTPDPEDLVKVQFTLEASSATIASPDVVQNVTTMDECLNVCVLWKAFRCQTLIHMRLEGQCLLIARDFSVINRTELVPHSQAFIYSRSYLVDYKPVLGGVALTTSGPVYTKVDHIETCAMYCSKEKSIKCLSFEWCYDSMECHLHSEHFLDVSGGGDYLLNTSCIHFSSKTDNIFTRYGNQGMPSTKHKLALVNSDTSSCAKLCTDDPDEVCESFDFCSECHQDDYGVCGQDNEGANNLCFIGTHHLGERDLKLVTSTHCAHYSRDLFGDLDYASWLAEQQKNDKVYTPGDMTWLAFGMIFLGALLAMGFLVVMVNYKPASVPKDLSVSFISLKTQGVSDV